MYLKYVSTGEIGEALKSLVGHETQGYSANTVSHLKSEINDVYILVFSSLLDNVGYTSEKGVEWKKVCDL